MVQFGNLDSADGLKKLNDHLLNASYIEGVEPTSLDLDVLSKVKSDGLDDYKNIRRWSKHINSFSDDERSKFSEGTDTIADTPASQDVPMTTATKEVKKDDDEFDADDLFGDDDEEDEEAYRIQQERAEAALKAKAERDAAKAAAGKKKEAAKSQIIFDVKPWDDTTDLAAMEQAIREISIDGATWGAAKRVPIGYGISKLQMLCTILDDKVESTEIIEEQMVELEDYVQSVDVAAFNKL
eukprot:Plantae.Rhodophyta-Purpureofilum_apyrenoidigerum.ctg10295.p1 GENE.Plantae.Rhodophyta-Purpureofilum_apyrenoidigerum.ctg10295~~Plantae.Rhodophyta-Purpureofilum_apyrenoidigerum.ctg10295.p1  ORF type:complete len:240 (-),score=81.65 Plantae.Rhodophyta-Purpureofilum_apyrenoidigerum.ctg10295:191-910(-)